MMQMQTLRPALGQIAKLGTLYDAREDIFLPLCILNAKVPRSVITRMEKTITEFDFSEDDSLQDRFNKMGLNTDLQASYLSGFVKVEGSGRYLNKIQNTGGAVEVSMYHRVTVMEESLEVRSRELADFLALDYIEGGFATHVVVGITWGANSIVTAKHQLSQSDRERRADITMELKERLKSLQLGVPGKRTGINSMQDQDSGNPTHNFEVHVDSDVFSEGDVRPTTFEGVCKFLNEVQQHISSHDGLNGKPVTYTLMPLQMLAFLHGNSSAASNTPSVQISRNTLDEFVNLFADFSAMQLALSDYHARTSEHQHCVPWEHIKEIEDQRRIVNGQEAALRSRFAMTLKHARAGQVKPESLWELLQEYRREDLSLEPVSEVLGKYTEKMDFFDIVIRKGAEYVGFSGGMKVDALESLKYHERYVFRFNWESQYGDPTLHENIAILLELLGKDEKITSQKVHILVRDCDGTGETVDRPHICHERNSVTITEDLAEERRERADKSFMQYDMVNFEKGPHKRPIKMAKVTLMCPGKACSDNLCDWICHKCHASISYGYSDNFLYCDCGRGLYNNWTFQCNDRKHGEGWSRWKGETLLETLNALEPLEPLNILILGETGVGKSTFINAFVNYLTYDTLDDAMKAKKLQCIIPFSFATQVVDKTSPRHPFITTTVSAGISKNEKDGSKGHSATQKTLVHSVQIGSRIVRLFDTPGIGDTRGARQDTENMADILSVLSNYDKLHGILILLKPNNARLTVMFRFCIKELLTHLHRDAARNMVFGFTNTRGSNYKPGDTFEPLKQELACNKEVDIGLFEETVYCFDSESFRYLAGYHQGVDLGDQGDYNRSWEKSAHESHRLLRYFGNLKPHQVKNTVSLNETRHLITELTKPMAEIMQVMNDTIKVNQDQIKSLREDKLKAQDLERQLYVTMRTLQAHKLDLPRTVCSDINCVDHQDDGTDPSKPNLRVVYKTQCHNPCYLSNVPADEIAHPELIHCAAFNGSFCKRCKHSWQVHLHILYELIPEQRMIRSKDTERKLMAATSEMEVKKIAIADKESFIAAIKAEYEEIEGAAIRFSIFLKQNSITPYNDATIDYLGFMIKEERGKVAVGGDRSKLDDLEKYLVQYQEQVKILTERMESGKGCELLNAQEVQKRVQELYSLFHYGSQLRQIKSVVHQAHGDTFREESHNVRVKSKLWRGRSSIREVVVDGYRCFRDGFNHLTRSRVSGYPGGGRIAFVGEGYGHSHQHQYGNSQGHKWVY
ncbi:hypothetical protein EV426DRAFT_641150 [Tirmania nivea]|nr:hypothetical protein EV426DRAFT_641150 [Tirmania nivea]